MSIIACLNRVFGRKNCEVKEKDVDVVDDAKIPRKYKVPNGLKARVLELHDKSEIRGSRFRSHEALWFLLNERCPETRDGAWTLVGINADVFVVEVL